MSLTAVPGGRRLVPALALGIAVSAQAAPTDPLGWLQRATQASRQASYEGTFVHINGDHTSNGAISPGPFMQRMGAPLGAGS